MKKHVLFIVTTFALFTALGDGARAQVPLSPVPVPPDMDPYYNPNTDPRTAAQNAMLMHGIIPGDGQPHAGGYGYAGDNPVTRTDPKGESWSEAIILLGLGGIAIQQLAEFYNNSHLQTPFPTLQPHGPFAPLLAGTCNMAYPTGLSLLSNTSVYSMTRLLDQQEITVPELDTLPEGPYVGLLPSR